MRAALRGVAASVLIVLAACSGGAGPSINDGTGTSGAVRPTVTLSAMPASITSGAGTMLSWNSTNATGCTASGGWNGPRGTSGSEAIRTLTQTTSFTLSCTGVGGTGQQAVQVVVAASLPAPAPPTSVAPTLTFSASQTDVPANTSVTLNWATTNATACTASGAWDGVRPTTGSEIVGPLAVSASYTLTCTGSGGSVQRSVTIVISGVNSGLRGSVDSSWINPAGSNQVYVFSGAVTPRDLQGSVGDPIFVLPVAQDANACTFSYSLPSLDIGTYTLAFTSQAQLDRPQQVDTLNFAGTTTVTVGSQPVRSDFRPAAVLQVGPGKPFTTIAAAAQAASEGSVIEVDASGTYTNDFVVWTRKGVVVRGVNGRPLVSGTVPIGNGKGLFVIDAERMRIENFEFSGARVADENGAAIRNEARDLTICNSFMHDNENGFLGAAFGTLTIEYSTFEKNGRSEGFTHNVYIDEGSAVGDRLVFRHNYSHRANIGHNLKTRARENFILYNRIMDENDGTASYAIDVSDGGISYIIGNLIQQGPQTDNPDIIAFNLENTAGARPQELYLVNNTLVNDLGSGNFINARSSTTTFRSINNLFIGAGTPYAGKLPAETTNLRAATSVLVDAANFNYRLNPGVAPINAGTDPGSVAGVSLVPEFQYVDFARRERRSASSAVDIGAYEATP